MVYIDYLILGMVFAWVLLEFIGFTGLQRYLD